MSESCIRDTVGIRQGYPCEVVTQQRFAPRQASCPGLDLPVHEHAWICAQSPSPTTTSSNGPLRLFALTCRTRVGLSLGQILKTLRQVIFCFAPSRYILLVWSPCPTAHSHRLKVNTYRNRFWLVGEDKWNLPDQRWTWRKS